MLAAWRYAAHGDWIFPAGQNPYEGRVVPSVRDPDLTGPLNAFDANYSATSLTVTADTGEGFVYGAYVGSDDTTVTDAGGDVVHDVDLAASTNNQHVYLGYDHTQTDVDALIIGKAGAFTSADQPRIHIWTFDTDGSGVTNATDHRPTGERIKVPNAYYDEIIEPNADGAVTQANNATTIENRSLVDLVWGKRDISVPHATIPAGDVARRRIDVGPGNASLIQQNHVTLANDSPTGLQTAVWAGDGTVLYEDETTISRAHPDDPLGTSPWDRFYLEFRLENNTGNPIEASAGWTLLIE